MDSQNITQIALNITFQNDIERVTRNDSKPAHCSLELANMLISKTMIKDETKILVITDYGLLIAVMADVRTNLNKVWFVTNSAQIAKAALEECGLESNHVLFSTKHQFFLGKKVIFEGMKFDVIIGNPPYNGVAKESIIDKSLLLGITRYASDVSYLPFLRKARQLLADQHSELSFIIPSSFLKKEACQEFVNQEVFGKNVNCQFLYAPFHEEGAFVREAVIIHYSPNFPVLNNLDDKIVQSIKCAIQKFGILPTHFDCEKTATAPSQLYGKYLNKKQAQAAGFGARSGKVIVTTENVDFTTDDKNRFNTDYKHSVCYTEWIPSNSGGGGQILTKGIVNDFMPFDYIYFCIPCKENAANKVKWFIEESRIMRHYIDMIRATDHIAKQFKTALPNIIDSLSENPSDDELANLLNIEDWKQALAK